MWTFQPLTALSDRSELVSFNCVQRSNKIIITKMMGASFMVDTRVVPFSLMKPYNGDTMRPSFANTELTLEGIPSLAQGHWLNEWLSRESNSGLSPLSLTLTKHGRGVSSGGAE